MKQYQSLALFVSCRSIVEDRMQLLSSTDLHNGCRKNVSVTWQLHNAILDIM